MKLHIKNSKLIVEGIVKTILDSKNLIDKLREMYDTYDTVTLEIKDSFVLPSSVIGYINKSVMKDKKHIKILAHDKELIDLFDMLSLTKLFNVEKY